MQDKLKGARSKWRKVLYNALMAARNKLSVYYGMTGPVKKGGGQGLLFNLGIILNPRDKLQWYNKDS